MKEVHIPPVLTGDARCVCGHPLDDHRVGWPVSSCTVFPCDCEEFEQCADENDPPIAWHV